MSIRKQCISIAAIAERHLRNTEKKNQPLKVSDFKDKQTNAQIGYRSANKETNKQQNKIRMNDRISSTNAAFMILLARYG